ncbi:MAG: 5'-3' exonuclease [Lentisphaeria bacterium]|nr:5'-3' exonuclease [Lentisphaeria bacterium]
MSDQLILMDAYSQIFRCFYAVRSLTNAAGEPVNALLPFGRLLLNLEKQHPGHAGAIVFDCGKVRFRMELRPEYKANRPPTPDDLKKQVPPIRELCGLFGWPILEEPEYEADDLIAALAQNYPGEVRIISSDKDLAQMITSRIAMLIPASGKGSWELRDEAAVFAKFAVTPDQIVDYLSLLGDSADNIPGVPGIGPKGAAQLLSKCGSLDRFYAEGHPDISPRIAGLLQEHREVLERNRKLITLRTDLPARLNCASGCCIRKSPDWEGIRQFCTGHGLFSLLKELPAAEPDELFPPDPPAAEEKSKKPEYEQGDLFADLF